MLIVISIMMGIILTLMWVGVCILDDIRSQYQFDEDWTEEIKPTRKTRSDKGEKRK